MYTPQTTGSAQKMPFFWALYDKISKVSISRELYIIINWLTFQNDGKKHLSISVKHNTYINDQRKWAEIRISSRIMNENFSISFETYFTITYKQIKKNLGKINFRIVGANFRKNLHLAVPIFADAVFFSFNFFFRC